MTTKLLATACVVSLFIPAIVLGFDNEPDGFRGIKWGTEFSANKVEMTLSEKGKDENFYRRKGDKMSIGGAELTGIEYGYWKGKLKSVIARSSGLGNKSALIAAFREHFGTPAKPNQFLDEYLWEGASTTIVVKCNSIKPNCFALLMSSALLAQKREEEKKAAAGAKGDF